MEIHRHAFRAMGTRVEVLTDASEDPRSFADAVVRVRDTFERFERRCSRFRPDSELSRINRRAGRPTRLSPELAELVSQALAAARRTSGRFDPTVLDAVVAAGYERGFDELLAGARAALRPPRACGRWREVRLEGPTLHLPEGVGLDLGGIAKGWTVDLAVAAALEAGLRWVLVNAGGDLRVAGDPPSEGIPVGVEDPEDPSAELLRLHLLGGALATSSTTRRAWGPGLHHLIDPATALPAATGVLQATAWAPTCAEAEVAAKDALLRGPGSLQDVPGVLVLADGRVLTNLEPGTVAA
ncbi:FAD:protein FMN transferase [bacterium HR12]|nr:FAD:protein FMN transferase [bacterium HR12]